MARCSSRGVCPALRTRLRAVSRTSVRLLTSPGIAVSGQTVQHLPQAVQFSGTQAGCSVRMALMSRNSAVEAGMRLSAMNGSARLSLPLPRA